VNDQSTDTRTPAEQLHKASQALRCEHRFPLQPPHGSLGRPGDCSKCGVPYDYSEPVTDDARDLRKKLADLFDHLADAMEEGGAAEREVRLDDGRRRKFVFCALSHDADETWTAALKVAREIHGGAR